MLLKTTHKGLAAAALAMLLSTSAFADDYPTAMTVKFGRGLANASLGWVELFKNVYNEPAQKGIEYAPVGLVKGIYHTVGRSLVGLFDMCFFIIPTQEFIQPTLVWENMETETTYPEWRELWHHD